MKAMEKTFVQHKMFQYPGEGETRHCQGEDHDKTWSVSPCLWSSRQEISRRSAASGNTKTRMATRDIISGFSLTTYYMDKALLICTLNFLKADPEWNLTREDVLNTKELFQIYDTDQTGVITYHQVKSAMKVLGHRFPGRPEH